MVRARRINGPLVDRLWAKIDVKGAGECWPWMASRSTTGYGQIMLDGKPQRAHREVLKATKGVPEPGKNIACHTCDNPICCNPDHLYWGSQSDNMRDARNRKRVGGKQKLTAEQAEIIRVSTKRVYELCTEFGISRWQVTNIRAGRQWT